MDEASDQKVNNVISCLNVSSIDENLAAPGVRIS